MRKLTFIFACLLLIAATCAQAATQVGSLYYSLDETAKTAAVEPTGGDTYTGDITIPASITYEGNTYIVTAINGKAFWDCSDITSITIPDGVTSIGSYAFAFCTSLSSITLPASVTTIEEKAFYRCIVLTGTLTIPAGVTSIGAAAFAGCMGITAISVESGNTHYDSRNNCNAIIETATGTLIAGCKNTTIPEDVQAIGDCAFSYTKISTITIPEGVTSIGEDAFYYSNLTSVTIPNGVTSIGSYAFGSCNSLTTAIIPATVTTIGDCAFQSCTNLTSFIVKAATPPTCGSDVFQDVPYSAAIYVPCGTASAYQAANGWSRFSNYTEQPYSITVLANDDVLGTATITQQPTCENNNAVISAKPNSYQTTVEFKRWSDGSTANPRTVVMASDTTLTAIFGQIQYTITAICDPVEGGTVTGAGLHDKGTAPYLKAVPNTGYHFTAWSDGSNVTSIQVLVTNDKTVTAYFAPNKYTITTVADNTRGYITGRGEYDYGTEVTLTPFALPHYQFSQWSDGNTDNPRKVKVTDDATYTALFIPQQYTVTTICDPVEGGSLTGGGVYTYLDTVTLTAVPNTEAGYHFAGWVNGVGGGTTIKRVVRKDTTYTAKFELNTYLIATNCDEQIGTVTGEGKYTHGETVELNVTIINPDYVFRKWSDGNTENPRIFTAVENVNIAAIFLLATKHELTVVSNNETFGSVTGSGVYEHNSAVGIEAIANEHYHFARWSDVDLSTNPRPVLLSCDTTITAIFEIDKHEIIASSYDLNQGSVEGGGMYDYGTEATLTANPEAGYVFSHWNDGNTDSPRTITVVKNETYTAYFDKSSPATGSDNPITINTANGTVEASKTTAQIGDEVTLTITPAAGYELDALSVKDADDNAIEVVDNTFIMPASAVTVAATFKKVNYDIAVIASENGKVESDKATAQIGDEVTLTITPAAGYELDALSVKDADDNAIEVVDNTFIMPASAVTVSATFMVKTAVALPNAELTEIYAADGRIYGPEDMRIFTIIGQDVTSQNGSLLGVYVVKCGGKVAKVIVR